MIQVDGRRMLLAFVRGESNWRSLTDLGLRIQLGNQSIIAVPAGVPVVRPTMGDVAAGLLAQPDAAARQEWAAVLLRLDNIDWASLESNRNGPALLEAIWDASRGLVPEASLTLASTLARSRMQH